MSISVYQSAGLVPYSNAISGLVATQVQAAIDELAGTLGTAILQDGNSFGENIVIGTNDNFQVNIETNGVQIAAFTPTGKLVLGSTAEYDPFAEDKLNILSSSDGSAQVFLQRNDLTLDNAVGGFENQGAMIFGVNAAHETGTYANLYGVYGNVFQDSTGNIDNAYGVFFECVKINSAGLLTNAYGINAAVRKIGADGKIRNAYGLYIAATHATGTDAGQTHTAAGIYIPSGAILASGGDTNEAYVIKSEDTSDSQLAGLLILGDDVRDPLNSVNESLIVADSFNGDGSKTLQYNKLTLTGTADGGGAYYALLSDINLDHTTGEYTSVNAFLNRAIHNSTGNIDTLILNDSSFVTASVGSVGTTGGVIGISVAIGNDQGILRNAYGLRILSLAAQGTDPGETHQAIGIYIPSGAIVASGGAVNNEYAILIEDDADSYMEGKLITNTGIELSASSPGNTLLSHYQEVAESNLGTLTWTAGTAPSGSINKKYKATRIGNRVDLWCRIEAATPGATVTAVSFPLPSDSGINTPVAFTGMGNGEFNVPGSGAITVGGALPTAGPCNAYLGKDGGGVWTVYITGPSSSADTAFCHISYFV